MVHFNFWIAIIYFKVFTKKNTTCYKTVKFKSRHNKWIFLAMTEIIVLILRNLHKVLSQTNLQHNLLHFFIRTLKLTNQDQHHFSGVVVGILCIHKRDQVPNGFEKSGKTLKKKRQHVRFKTQTLKTILLFPFSFPFT